MDLNMILPIWRPCNFSFNTFFQTQKPLGSIQNQVRFHVDITHSPMLDIIWMKKLYLNLKLNLFVNILKEKSMCLLFKTYLCFQKCFFTISNLSHLTKKITPMFGFCANSNKTMWSWVWVTKTCFKTLGFNIGN